MGLIFLLWLVYCGSTQGSDVQPISFADNSVSFQNKTCAVQLSVINDGSGIFTLSFLTGSFVDKAGHKYQTELDQNAVTKDFDKITLGPGGISKGKVTFNLSKTSLDTPISATVIIVGISDSQVTNFVGNFTCE